MPTTIARFPPGSYDLARAGGGLRDVEAIQRLKRRQQL
jgi:hypothetical protein